MYLFPPLLKGCLNFLHRFFFKIDFFYRLTEGKIPIIGCGGISSGEDAYEKIRLGASLIQFYSALVYQGFPVTGRIKRELVDCLRKDGFTNIQQAIGIQHKKS